MILYQDDPGADEKVTQARLACLEALSVAHMVHCYQTVDSLELFLEMGLSKIRHAGLTGYMRVVLIYSDPAAIAVVTKRMQPGVEFPAWHQPDAWLTLYKDIAGLRTRARRFDPHFLPRYE